MARDSVSHTLLVSTLLCVVCSVLVAGAAVGLRERQEINKQVDRYKNILQVANRFDDQTDSLDDVARIYEAEIKSVLIDLETGQPVADSDLDSESYDPRIAAKDLQLSTPIEPANGLGGIKRREKYAFVYEVRDESGQIEQVVLPIYGKGLWSTLYGFLAVSVDANTIRGITFYEHGETPGLGGEIDNPLWKSLWPGKQLFGESGEVAIEVIKGAVSPESSNAAQQVDGLSGATITSDGVTELIRYWMGPAGFGPYLDQLSKSSGGTRG